MYSDDLRAVLNRTWRLYPRISAPILGCLLGVGVVNPAHAMSRYIQLDLESAKLGELLRQRLMQEQMCPEPIACAGGAVTPGCPADQEEWLDHIDIGEAGSFAAGADQQMEIDDGVVVTAPVLEFHQPVEIFTRMRSCIETPGCATYEKHFEPTLIVELFAKEGELCAKVTGFNVQFLNSYLPPDMMQPICTTLDIGGAGEMLGGEVEVAALGFAPNADLSRLAFRFELAPTEGSTDPADMTDAVTRTSDWQSFYGGNFGPGAGNDQFTLFITERLLREGIAQQLSGIKSSGQLVIDAGPDVTWSPASSPAGEINAEFSAHAEVDECWNDIGLSPVLVDLPMTIDGAMNAIDVSGTFSWNVSDWDLFVCAISEGAFDPIATSVLFGLLEDAASSLKPDDLALPGACEATGATTFDCSFPVSLPALRLNSWGPFGGLDLQGGIPSTAGLALTGDVILQGLFTDSPLKMTVDSIQYGAYGGCSTIHTGYEGSVHISGFGSVCNVTTSEDTYNVYVADTAGAVGWGAQDVPLKFYPGFALCDLPDCDPPVNLFWEKPYPLVVTAYTSSGAGSVLVDPPVQATPEQMEKLAYDMIEFQANCMAEQTGLFGIPGMYDPHWDIDPPPYELVTFGERGEVIHIGTVEILDLIGGIYNVTDERGNLNTRGVELDVTVYALATVETLGTELVTFDVNLTTDLAPTYGRDGSLLRLAVVEGAAVSVDLSRSSDALPAGSTLTMDLARAGLAVEAGL